MRKTPFLFPLAFLVVGYTISGAPLPLGVKFLFAEAVYTYFYLLLTIDVSLLSAIFGY